MNKNLSSFMLSSHCCAICYEHYNLQIVSNPGMFHYSSIIYEVMQVLMRSVKLWYSSVTKDIFHLTGSFMISLSVSIQKIRLDKRDFPIWYRSDPNITTRVPDLVCLSTCKYMYVRIRNYTFIAN